MSNENVLIWPKQYPLLLKGLLEQNGAHILDALEQWPQCEEKTDVDGLTLTILPPMFYLLWQKPAEPFQECTFQHIFEYEDADHQYVEQVLVHLKAQLEHNEKVTLLLLERLAKYVDFTTQFEHFSLISPACLCLQLHYFNVLKVLLENGLLLNEQDILTLWQDTELHELLLPYLGKAVKQTTSLLETITERLINGEDYFGLLVALQHDETDLTLLEKALLAHIRDDSAKQTLCKRFLAQGATGTLADDQGMTALMWAAKRGFIDVLVNQLDDSVLKQTDNANHTLLHQAVMAQNEQCIALMLKSGIDYTVKNADGLTAYQLAVSLGYRNVIKLLEKDFGIRELSPEQQIKRIRLVHSLHALACWLFPVQLFFFFMPDFDFKSETSFVCALMTMLMLFYAMSLKRCNLYPYVKHPWSLTFIRGLSFLSLALQLMMVVVVVVTALS